MHRRLRSGLLLFAFANALGLLEFLYRYLDVLTRQRHESPWITFLEEFTGAYSALALVPVVIWMTRRFPLGPGTPLRTWLRNLSIHMPVLIAGAILATSVMWGSRSLLFPWFGLGPYSYGKMPTRYFMEFPIQMLGYAIVVSLTMLYDRQTRATQLEKSLARAQLHNLRLQLQPHFLFNTLNTISSVMYENVGVADKMIARLSDLLRMSLEQGGAQEVPLEREIEFLKLYVETMKARFEERLNVAIEATEETRAALVPPLLLQPLVENSIRHGADPDSSIVDVRVSARRENGLLRLEVRDRGPGLGVARDAALRKGIGLSNTAERLERLYGGAHPVGIENAPEGGLVVTLMVPFHVDSRAAG
ncbi:MAG TPA: histidine kinase [Bryobacteraceae bacterium]|nr:histidine kinase [Bryobacteraceae bacterium]